jgi:hypothetical protein
LRVFVSSTLGELAEERRAVSRAISALRLTPVMFEVGARPHPPQDLYQAYLAQSDVSVPQVIQRRPIRSDHERLDPIRHSRVIAATGIAPGTTPDARTGSSVPLGPGELIIAGQRLLSDLAGSPQVSGRLVSAQLRQASRERVSMRDSA